MAKKWQGTKPEKCQICGVSFEQMLKGAEFVYFVDGKAISGPWRIMCGPCHAVVGSGLGTGAGQKYKYPSLERA